MLNHLLCRHDDYVEVDPHHYAAAMQKLRHLQSLLLCISQNDRKALNALPGHERIEILKLAHSLANEVSDEFNSGFRHG